MKEIPDDLWDQIMAFLCKVDDGELLYMEGAGEPSVYDDAADILEAVGKLEEERGQ